MTKAPFLRRRRIVAVTAGRPGGSLGSVSRMTSTRMGRFHAVLPWVLIAALTLLFAFSRVTLYDLVVHPLASLDHLTRGAGDLIETMLETLPYLITAVALWLAWASARRLLGKTEGGGMTRMLLPLALVLAGPVLAQTASEPAIFGRVTEVFANRMILELGNERVLAEPSDGAAVLTARPGDAVRIEGDRHGPIVRWRSVTVAAPSVTFPQAGRSASAGGTSDADLLQSVERLGLKAIDPPLRKRHHIEVLAQTTEGRKLYISFDREGRLWEIEDATYDRHAATPRNLSSADYERLAREAGFSPIGQGEERRRHVELEVRNQAGETLTLHIDRAGVIYKQVWRR